MSTKQVLRIALLAAAAVALTVVAAELQDKRRLADETVSDIEAQIAALDPATRAAVVGRLATDAAGEAKQRLNP
jgi:hypothetical protein